MTTRVPSLLASACLPAALFLNFGSSVGLSQTSTNTQEQALEMNVFEVVTSKDEGYAATNTLSGTRTNEALANLPNSISVLNRRILDDLAVENIFEAVEFTLGAENISGDDGFGSTGNVLLYRGIQNNYQSRDSFQWYVPVNTFNTERIESNRGPTGQIYGDAGAGGVLNVVTKQARTDGRSTELRLRFDSEGGQAYGIDHNQKLSERLAARINLNYTDKRDWREDYFDKNKGAAASVIYKLSPRTNLRLNGEWGVFDRNPGAGTPSDRFSGYTLGTGSTADLNGAAAGLVNPAGTTLIRAQGTNQQYTFINGTIYNLESTGPNSGGVNGLYFRQSTEIPGALFSVDPNLIPYHWGFSGPSRRTDRDYYTYTLTFDHRFGENLSLEISHNVQSQVGNNFNVGGQTTIRRDVMPELPNPSGAGTIPNPNYERLYVEHYNNQLRVSNLVRNYRATLVYDWKPFDWMSQRLVGTGSLRDDTFENRLYDLTFNQAFIDDQGLTGTAARYTSNRVFARYYIDDGRGENLRIPYDPAIMRFTALGGGGFQGRRQELYSGSLNAFGKYFNERVTTSIGIRRDRWNDNTADQTTDAVTGEAFFVTDENGETRFRDNLDIYNTAFNYGAVFHVLPQLSLFYNYAETFQFNSGVTVFFNGDQSVPRTGDGVDFGLRFSLMENRLTGSVTFFDNYLKNVGLTAVNNQTMADEINDLLDPVGRRYTTGRDTRETNTSGVEVEIVLNLTKNWTTRLAVSTYDRVNQQFAPRLLAVLEEMRSTATSPTQYAITEARYNQLLSENPRDAVRPNFATRYNFDSGKLKGLYIGANGYWREGEEQNGNAVAPAFKTSAYLLVNGLIGYRYKIGEMDVNSQLNINNLLDDQTSVGGYANRRFVAPRQFILTNTVRF